MSEGIIFNIQPFSLHDGPGTRTTVFMKGCSLRCWWCHNPESWHSAPELMFYRSRCIGCGACAAACPQAENGLSARFTPRCTGCGRCADACFADALQLTGERITPGALAAKLLEDADVFRRSGGGVTFSGGEPLLQADFLLDVINRLKSENVHVAVETALNVPSRDASLILRQVDLAYCDIKHMDPVKHKKATGVSNEHILQNITGAASKGVRMTLRTPVIPGFNDNEDDIRAIAAFIAGLPGKIPAELLAFHGLCSGKYEALDQPFRGLGLREPSRETMERLTQVMQEAGVDASYRM